MTTTVFLTLLSAFSVITGLTMEAVKKIIEDKEFISYNITTVVIALIIGGFGTLVYYQLNSIPFTVNNMICAVLMGFASGLVAMTSYDKVVEAIKQLSGEY